MNIKNSVNLAINESVDLLKSGEENIEKITGTSIDIFSEPKNKMQKEKDKITSSTKKSVEQAFDPKGKIIINNTLNKLKIGYEALYNKLPDKEIDEGEHKGKTYKEVLQLEYDNLVKKIKSCKNDGELKTKYNTIKSYIDSWINDLEEEGTGIEKLYSKITNLDQTKTKTIKSLLDLKGELAVFEGVKKQKVLKAELEKKKEKLDTGNKEKDNITSTLKKFGIPAGIAGIIAGFIAMFTGGKGNGEKGFFSSVLAFFKNPVDSIMDYFGYGDKKEDKKIIKDKTQTEKKEKIKIPTGKIIDIKDGKKYTNGALDIEIKNNSISKIKIEGINYEINLNYLPDTLLGNVNIINKNKTDILTIGKTEINLLNFVKNNDLKNNQKDEYILIKDFEAKFDLVIKKI